MAINDITDSDILIFVNLWIFDPVSIRIKGKNIEGSEYISLISRRKNIR